MAEKTAGQWIGTIVGAVVGFYTGGATWYATAGAMASGASVGAAVGGMLDPPKGPQLVGPRVSDLSVQTSTYGAPIPRVYGTVAQYGNIFWLENNQIKETTTQSGGGGKGGGSPETTSYSYSATFAVGLCKGPIAGIRRLWIGPNLVYDAAASDISTIVASNLASSLFTLYTGSDTQLPDDRMQAALGIANTPAFRGLAYIVFKDLPLADYSNSLLGAQIKVEIAGGVIFGVPRKIYEKSITNISGFRYRPIVSADDATITVYAYNHADGFTYNPSDFSYSANNPRLINISIGSQVSDNKTGAKYLGRIPQYFSSGTNTHDLGKLGDVEIWFPEYSVSTAIHVGPRQIFPMGALSGKNTASASGSLGDLSSILPAAETGRYINGFAISEDGKRALIVTGANDRTYSDIGSRYFFIDSSLNIIKSGNILSPTVGGFQIGDSSLLNGATAIHNDRFAGWSAFDSYSWITVFSFSINSSGDMTISQLLPNVSLIGGGYGTAAIKNNIFYVIFPGSNETKVVAYTDAGTASSDSALLSEIVEKECLLSNMLSLSDLDTTALTQSVRGYRISSTAAIRGGIEPLQGAYPFDAIQSGYKIKFKPRGSASVATIPAIDLDAREGSKAAGSVLIIAREMDSIIPRRVVLKHMDIEREYDMGEQYAERLNTSAVNIQTVETAIVMTPTEAAKLAEVLLYLYWLERYDINFSLPPSYSRLEPADVVTVVTASASYDLRLTSITYTADGRLECAAKYNSAAIYNPTAIGVSGASTGNVLMPIGSATYELLDIPLLLDATDTPGFPVAMAGYLAGWTGGALFRTDDAGQTWTNLQAFVAPGSVIGYASAAIGAGQIGLFDTASVLPVSLISGDLSSVTEAQLLGGANYFAYGADGRWEIIAAQNCALQGDGSYILSKLLRGRFGSEWACGLHQSGDRVILLDSNRLKFLTTNLNAIGLSRTYRGITAGKALASDSDKAFTYQGVNLECLAPVYLNGNRHPTTNDWSLDWIRRTRVGGEWRDYVDATLGEASQAYEVEIYSSAAYTTLKRTITGLTTPAAAYTSAQQVADFGSNQATLYVKVYQLSVNVGRGYPLTTSITR